MVAKQKILIVDGNSKEQFLCILPKNVSKQKF